MAFFKKGSRTVLFNGVVLATSVAAAALGMVTSFVNDPAIRDIIPPSYGPGLFALIAAANIILRAVTDTPIFRSGTDQDA